MDPYILMQLMAEEIENTKEKRFEARAKARLFEDEMNYFAGKYHGLQDRVMEFNRATNALLPLDPVIFLE